MKPLSLISFPRALGWSVAFALAAIPTEAVASLTIPGVRPAGSILLSGGTVVTVSGPVMLDTDVLLTDGRIAAMGTKLTAPAGTQIIDVKNRFVYPGLITADTQLGLTETLSVRATLDIAETSALNPSVRAQVAVNPDSELIPVARSNGVLTALAVPVAAGPGSGPTPSLITGTSALLRLDGWTWEDVTLRAAVALHVQWPDLTIDRSTSAPKNADEQQKAIDERRRLLDDAFASARAYALGKSASADGAVSPTVSDLRWEALLPVVRGELPIFVRADTRKQIRSALAWARRQQLKITLVGAREARLVIDELRAGDVPVILGGTHALPLRRDDDFDAMFTTPARLHSAGVRFAIAAPNGGPSDDGNERNLPYHAGKAVAYGLPHDVALRAITLSAAELLGVGAELGSIEIGKRATLIVTDGDPLEIPTRVHLAFIDGTPIDLDNRQTALAEKYRERLRRLER